MFPSGLVGLAVVLPRSALAIGLFILFVCGLGPGAGPVQGLDYTDSSNAPASWTQFAQLVQRRFETWISADDQVASRFRAYVEEQGGRADGLPSSLLVKAWLNSDGRVERVSFPPLPDAQADADLHAILTRGNIGKAPPPEMLQPLNMRFSLNLRK